MLFNRCLLYFLVYVIASNTTFPFENLFHGSYFLHVFLPCSSLPLLMCMYHVKADYAITNAICYKIFLLNICVGHRPYENFSTWKFLQRKFPDLRYSAMKPHPQGVHVCVCVCVVDCKQLRSSDGLSEESIKTRVGGGQDERSPLLI